jgi:hypothetical protein
LLPADGDLQDAGKRGGSGRAGAAWPQPQPLHTQALSYSVKPQVLEQKVVDSWASRVFFIQAAPSPSASPPSARLFK